MSRVADVGRGKAEPERGRSAAEWTSLVVAALVLAGVVGLVLTLWLTVPNRPPEFELQVDEIRQTGGQYYLTFTMRNAGDQTGSEVQVEGVLPASGDAAEQRASITFDFVPAQATVDGVLIFARNPAGVQLRVVSYQPPD